MSLKATLLSLSLLIGFPQWTISSTDYDSTDSSTRSNSTFHTPPLRVILSTDGGGARGIIPAVLVEKLEQEFGSHLSQHIDLFAGTSTGGLISLGLVAPNAEGKPLLYGKDIVKIYGPENGARIFERSLWYKTKTLWGLAGSKYPATGLETVIDKTFGSLLATQALKPFLIPTYVWSIQGSSAVGKFAPTAFEFTENLRDVYSFASIARATSAAPTYFPPAEIRSRNSSQKLVCTDGGICANNPALMAYLKVLETEPQSDIMVISLGTGTYETPKTQKELNTGPIGTVVPLIDSMFDASSDLAHQNLQKLLPERNGIPKYIRLNPTLTAGQDSMDNVSPEYLNSLMTLAQEEWNTHEEIIQNMVAHIKANKKGTN